MTGFGGTLASARAAGQPPCSVLSALAGPTVSVQMPAPFHLDRDPVSFRSLPGRGEHSTPTTGDRETGLLPMSGVGHAGGHGLAESHRAHHIGSHVLPERLALLQALPPSAMTTAAELRRGQSLPLLGAGNVLGQALRTRL